MRGPTETFLRSPDASRRDCARVPLTLARLLLFHRRLHHDLHTSHAHVVVKTACESEQTLSVQRYMRLKIGQIHSQWRGDRWPCWIRFRLFPRASALGKRCTVVDTVSKQYRTPPRSPIRARGQKCMLSDDAREKSVSGACVPTAGMKAHGRANRLIDLVLSSTIDHTQRVFTKRTSWHGRFFLQDPSTVL